MKNEKSLKGAVKGRLKQAQKQVNYMAGLIDDMNRTGYIFDGGDMDDLRNANSILTQCIHEYNAYNNALTTD